MEGIQTEKALDGRQWSASRWDRFIPEGNRPRYSLNKRLGVLKENKSPACTGNRITISELSRR